MVFCLVAKVFRADFIAKGIKKWMRTKLEWHNSGLSSHILEVGPSHELIGAGKKLSWLVESIEAVNFVAAHLNGNGKLLHDDQWWLWAYRHTSK